LIQIAIQIGGLDCDCDKHFNPNPKNQIFYPEAIGQGAENKAKFFD
jgi:hypothetical protein